MLQLSQQAATTGAHLPITNYDEQPLVLLGVYAWPEFLAWDAIERCATSIAVYSDNLTRDALRILGNLSDEPKKSKKRKKRRHH